MLHSFVASSALLRTQRTALPRTFCRYKSITAAIEKGRGSGPDRFAGPRSGSRTRTSFRDDEAASSRYENRDGGRSRPSRSKSSIGARRRRWEDEDVAPRRKELRKSGGRSEESAVDRRIRDQDHERPARFGRDDERTGRSGDRPRREGFEQSDRPPRGAERTFDRDERAPRRDRDDFQKDDRPQRRPEKTFGRDERAPRKRDDFQKDDRPQRTFEGTFNREDRRSPRNDRDSRTAQSDRSSRFDRMDRTPRSSHSDRPEPSIPSRADPRDRAPDSLPYTTAASEFIYGYSSVLAAIRAQRRQFYKLYVNSRGLNRDILLARAKASNLRQITREVGDQYDRAFDKASSGRPHNGFILEASPLPVPPITELKECAKDSGKFEVVLGPQTKEELAVNGSRTSYTYKSTWRFPLILYLDGILDEGNLGAIARSAYFLGVEAIITPTRQSAPWSHIAVKASAGAAEAIPIFKVQEPAEFLGHAARNGWRCYAADAVPASKAKEEDESTSDIVYTQARSNKRLDEHSPVVEHPTILMLGAEGTGLKASLQNIAHYKVGIKHGREVDEVGVDSLNVSVAASLLCHDMLKHKKTVERDPENVVF
jgi:21S rRNA (GM2251-2'-O)-methyltransferase